VGARATRIGTGIVIALIAVLGVRAALKSYLGETYFIAGAVDNLVTIYVNQTMVGHFETVFRTKAPISDGDNINLEVINTGGGQGLCLEILSVPNGLPPNKGKLALGTFLNDEGWIAYKSLDDMLNNRKEGIVPGKVTKGSNQEWKVGVENVTGIKCDSIWGAGGGKEMKIYLQHAFVRD